MEASDSTEPAAGVLSPEARRQRILAKSAKRMALVVGGNVDEVSFHS